MVYYKPQQSLLTLNCLDYIISFLNENKLGFTIHPNLNIGLSYEDLACLVVEGNHVDISRYYDHRNAYCLVKYELNEFDNPEHIYSYLVLESRTVKSDYINFTEIKETDQETSEITIKDVEDWIGWDLFCHLSGLPYTKDNLKSKNDLDLGLIGKKGDYILFKCEDGKGPNALINASALDFLCPRYGNLGTCDSLDGHYSPEVFDLYGIKIPVYEYGEFLYMRESPGRVKLTSFIFSELSKPLSCECCHSKNFKNNIDY